MAAVAAQPERQRHEALDETGHGRKYVREPPPRTDGHQDSIKMRAKGEPRDPAARYLAPVAFDPFAR
jgi:hypothetical protein